MNPVSVILLNDLRRFLRSKSTLFAISLCLAAIGVLFSYRLCFLGDTKTSLSTIWALAVSPVLPALAALAGSGAWASERQSKHDELLLSLPISEYDIIFGKYLSLLSLTTITIVFSLPCLLIPLGMIAPDATGKISIFEFIPSFMALLLQSAMWNALAISFSAFCRSAVFASAIVLFVSLALPRIVWNILPCFSESMRIHSGAMPIDTQTYDMSTGFFSAGAIVSYISLSAAFLLTAASRIQSLRYRGAKARLQKFAPFAIAVLSAAVALGLSSAIARMDIAFDIPAKNPAETMLSERTRNILAENHGEVAATLFMSRKKPEFRHIDHCLRSLEREAATIGAVKLTRRYVDPAIDVDDAIEIIKRGIKADSLIVENGRRQTWLPLNEGWNERLCASAILSVTLPPSRMGICWTTGHGEISHTAYDIAGMSDIARELTIEGYRNTTINLTKKDEIPADCALMVIAGPKQDFSRAELARLDRYLRNGGRLLALLTAHDSSLAQSLIKWGVRFLHVNQGDATKSFNGRDIIAEAASHHPIVEPLYKAQFIFSGHVAAMPSTVSDGSGADKIEWTPLAADGNKIFAAVCERGKDVGQDVGIRPTRIVVICDPVFATNGKLTERANGNRDLFINSIAYLSGTDAMTAGSQDGAVAFLAMNHKQKKVFILIVSLIIPAAMALCFLLVKMLSRK